MDPKDGPEPGKYEKEDETEAQTAFSETMSVKGKPLGRSRTLTTAEYEKRLPNSTFRSTTDRFSLCYASQAPNIRILKKANAQKNPKML